MPIPPDDPTRELTVVSPDDPELPHIGLAGDTYTVLVNGENTAGRYCLIDMLIPPGGGPGPHRHDFEEMFTLLEGEVEFTFRGRSRTVHAGQTVNIPANAPHFFRNATDSTVRMLCMCTPAGQEEFFATVGVPVPTRTSQAPRPAGADLEAQVKLILENAPRYRTEILPPA
ncbi:cupin domain-containing protein [Pseudonocardia acaciae]|uniref:cupin domain-containing protein n=1 Tax=Pseudonocardia acaciae TaxID=551276 RepID=UPI00048AA62F|nr:cupin domain-containing protein [Pseudonocardia acaciae]